MLLGLWFFACSSSIPAGDLKQPDVILVSIDTLRADHLSCYGYERETSPFLDRLAVKGVRFTDARSPSHWTLPTHTTMMTGLHPHRHGVVDDTVQRSSETEMLAELMQKNGYRTAGVVSSLYVSSVFGFDKGFDHFEDFALHTERANLSGQVDAKGVVDAALAWWKKQEEGKPIFLFVHFYDAHYAYEPPPLSLGSIFYLESERKDLMSLLQRKAQAEGWGIPKILEIRGERVQSLVTLLIVLEPSPVQKYERINWVGIPKKIRWGAQRILWLNGIWNGQRISLNKLSKAQEDIRTLLVERGWIQAG